MATTVSPDQRRDVLAKYVNSNPDTLKDKGTGPFGKGRIFESNGKNYYALTDDEIHEVGRQLNNFTMNPTGTLIDGAVWNIDNP